MHIRCRQDPSASGSCVLLVPRAWPSKATCQNRAYKSLSGCVMLMLCAPGIECIGPILTDLLYHYSLINSKFTNGGMCKQNSNKHTQKNLLDVINGAF